DEHAGRLHVDRRRDDVARADLELHRHRRRGHELVPDAVGRRARRAAVGSRADLLERVRVGGEAAEPDPERGERRLAGRARDVRLDPRARNARIGERRRRSGDRRAGDRVGIGDRVPGPVRALLVSAGRCCKRRDGCGRGESRGRSEHDSPQAHDDVRAPNVADTVRVCPPWLTSSFTTSPGWCWSMIARSSCAVATFVPSMLVITSPPVGYWTPAIVVVPVEAFSPALSAPLPGSTFATATPAASPIVPARLAGIVSTSMPSSACLTVWPAMICDVTRGTVCDGIAKPMPSSPPPELWICAVTPMTLPSRLSSTPPEFPCLIAASVWIAFSIGMLLG